MPDKYSDTPELREMYPDAPFLNDQRLFCFRFLWLICCFCDDNMLCKQHLSITFCCFRDIFVDLYAFGSYN